jgi:hypothetical protein
VPILDVRADASPPPVVHATVRQPKGRVERRLDHPADRAGRARGGGMVQARRDRVVHRQDGQSSGRIQACARAESRAEQAEQLASKSDVQGS